MGPIHIGALNSALKAQRWQANRSLRIGSLPDLEISCQDQSLKPRHARVAACNNGWFIYDESGGRGTYLNGILVGPNGQKLHANDVLQCGRLLLKILGVESIVKTSLGLVRIEAVAQRSWEKAVAGLTVGPFQNHLLMLFRTGSHLCRVECPEELMEAVLGDTVAAMGAQRGSIVFVDDLGTFHLRKAVQSDEAPPYKKWYSKTLIRRCFVRGESLLCQDISSDSSVGSAQSTLRQNMSSIICALLRTPRRKLGVLHLDRGPWQAPFTPSDLSLADAIAASISAGLETAQVIEQQRELFLHTVTALARAVEIRDQYTGDHTQRVTDYALLLADKLGLPATDRQILKIGTPLHDIGKIGISDAVLRKPGPLTREEFEHMKTHPLLGASLLDSIPGLRQVIPLVRNHHERWDGTGYPDHLVTQAIPPLARVVAVADAFDAMTSSRPYRLALAMPTAFQEIEHQAGTHFAPETARAFLDLRPQIESHRDLQGTSSPPQTHAGIE